MRLVRGNLLLTNNAAVAAGAHMQRSFIAI